MKIECSAEKLKNGLMLAERITGKNLSLPVLNSVLIDGSRKSLKIRATNLSLGIEIEIPGKITVPGIVAVRGNVITSVFSNITTSSQVVLETANDNLVVETKKDKLVLKSQPTDDFPTLPSVSGVEFSLPAHSFIEGLKSVYYSAAVSDIKQEIATVYIYPDGEYLVFVSTDSFRLAEKKIKIKKITEFEGFLIPFKNINEIIRTFSGLDEDIRIIISKNQVSFFTQYIYLTSRVIDGVFPDYKQILPKEFKSTLVVLREDLLAALKMATVFSDSFNQITLSLMPKEKKVEIYAKSADIGENRTALDAAVNGESVEVNINLRYLLDCFQSITSDSVTISLNESTRPIVVSGVSDTSFLYLIMPMNR
ncbi:MAG: DNA polymerase III subunit beta [Candidatus Pacebacteria bacterium]|jgi:DNA polymerase-3 subunit beta|nr:DNA polymerase III subunit beta [Candidatus Paceibacterota bacterium]